MGTKLVNRATGERELVDDADVSAALASGKYLQPTAVAAHIGGEDTYIAPEQLQRNAPIADVIDPARAALARGADIRRERNQGLGSLAKAVGGGAASGLSLGLLNPWEEQQEFNPGGSIAGQFLGSLAPAAFGQEEGIASAIARDGVATEHAAAGMSSRMLYAGEVGGEAGTAARGLDRGLLRAGDAMAKAKAAGVGLESADVAGDLAGMSAKDLRAERAAELERIEAQRVPDRADLAGDLTAFRADMKDQKLWLATKDSKDAEVRALGKRTLKADRQLDSLLDNPKRLAEKPELAKAALQQQEAALESIAAKGDELRKVFAADTSGERVKALEAVPRALERNRALQRQMAELVAEPSSPRLAAIDNARDILSTPKPPAPPIPPESLSEKMLKGAIFGKVTAAVGLTPAAPLAHVAGAKASDLIGRIVFGRMGEVAAEGAAKTKSAVDALLDVGKKSIPTLPVASAKILANARFAGGAAPADSSGKDLAGAFKARSAELRSQTAYDAAGVPRVRPEARQQIASRLDPIRAISPELADRLETHAVKRLEFLSSKLPRQPDFGTLQIGPNSYMPPHMKMAEFARFVAAAEKPGDVEHRLATGRISPEDAETYRALYPERFAALQQDIMQRLPTLQKTLPYGRRIALSIFTGVAVDPTMSPAVIATLQGHFAKENGSEGGTSNPAASPQFGSVKKSAPEPTPGEKAAQGG